MKKTDFFYNLPPELIAQTPLLERDSSRLLCLNKINGKIEHSYFRSILDRLSPGDCLVMNDSRVIPARLFGSRKTGGAVETVLLHDLGNNHWECLTRPGRKTPVGTLIYYGDGLLTAEVVEAKADGNKVLKFSYSGIFMEILDQLGQMPLPPYIKEKLNDKERYQTVYSREPGSAAAPTAGLHFTTELLDKIREKGIKTAFVTLHVGLGTFRPVKEENIENHLMHSEYCEVPPETANAVNTAHKEGHRVIAVGTTSCRTLESFTDADGILHAQNGWTDIFIYPGYKFRCIDELITNFHLPESTLLMLISALAGRENVMTAYEEAVREQYRFFSFGDAMFIHNRLEMTDHV